MTIRILAVGDVCGKPGLEFLQKHLKSVRKLKGADFTIVNGENASVVGLTPQQADSIFNAGADVVTLGNHTWSRAEIKPYLNDNPHILRPANFAPACPGRGFVEVAADFGFVRVICLIGRYNMDPNVDSPFLAADRLIKRGGAINLVEFHAEGTSEKGAIGYYLDGRVSAVWGTHTHVQTSDAMVLPQGTGFITDLGMTGPIYSILGIRPEQSVSKFLGEPPRRYESAERPCKMEACLFEIDPESGKCLSAEAFRIQ